MSPVGTIWLRVSATDRGVQSKTFTEGVHCLPFLTGFIFIQLGLKDADFLLLFYFEKCSIKLMDQTLVLAIKTP